VQVYARPRAQLTPDKIRQIEKQSFDKEEHGNPLVVCDTTILRGLLWYIVLHLVLAGDVFIVVKVISVSYPTITTHVNIV
jgi:hypothetical protein